MIQAAGLSFAAGALAVFVIAAGAAHAADAAYPSRPVRLLVGFAPGGGIDAMARILSAKLSDAMGETWLVDNRGGVNGNLASEIVVRANADGHTVLIAVDSQITVNPILYKLPFNPQKDLQPVTLLTKAEHLLAVHPSVPAKTLKEFIALAKQKPGSMNYASSGVGGSLHMHAELLKRRTGIELVHVAYKGGGPAAAAVLAGETQVIAGTIASTIAFVTAGRLRALAITGANRSKLLPDLPTVAESGYPGFEANSWYALLVPAGTPQGVSARIRDEAIKALQLPDVPIAMARQGLIPITSTQAELAARIKAETELWANVIRDAGIRAE